MLCRSLKILTFSRYCADQIDCLVLIQFRMDDKLMKKYLDKIAELVIEEDKIVTYKSLSRSFGIHVNTAKQLLSTFLLKEKSRNSFPISATYLLVGKVKDGSFNISIVNEVDLTSTCSKFVEITSNHVYSIQKGKNLKELKLLCGTDEDFRNCTSPSVIKCSRSILKSGGEIKKKTNTWEDNNKKVIRDAFASEKEEGSSVRSTKSLENCTNEADVIKSPLKKSPTKKSPKGGTTKVQVESKKPTGSIADLFAKAAGKNVEKSVKDTKSSIGNPQSDFGPLNTFTSAAEGSKADLTSEKRNSDKEKKCKESARRKIGNKRKRIQLLSDSEDSESSSEKTSPVKENSPPSLASFEEDKEEVIKEFVPQNKRKKRKVIDRTVMNEDGYLETKKEVIFETDSENEIIEEGNSNSEQKKEKVIPVIEKGKGVQTTCATKKQSSLLSFFKKN